MNNELCDELIADAENRAVVYGLLSSLFLKELTSEQIKTFRKQNMEALYGSDERIDSGLADMALYFGQSASRDARTELAADYAHTILGVTADTRLMALPYESLYTSGEQLLMRESRDDVYRIYCSEHLGTPEGKDVPEDHLGLMFEFLSIMCTRYAESLHNGEISEAVRLAKLSEELMQNHIANWIDAYCDVLEEVARTKFYCGLGKITRGWVHGELESMQNIILDTEDVQNG